MDVKVYIPHLALQHYVLNILTVDALLPGGMEEAVSPFPPSPFQSLIFYCNDPVSMGRPDSGEFLEQPLIVLTGPQIERVNIKVHKRLRSIRVDFLPGAMYRILGIPMHELTNGGFDASDFFDLELRTVKERLQKITDLKKGKDLIEKFLLNKLNGSRELLPFDAAIATAFTHLWLHVCRADRISFLPEPETI